MKSKYLFMFLTFSATIAQGLWSNWLEDELIVVSDIPLAMLLVLGRKRLRHAPYVKGALVFTVLFFLWSHIGVFFAPNQLFFRQEMILNIRAALFFLVFVSYINTQEELQNVFLGYAIGLIFQGLIGVHQWLRGPVGLGFLGEQPIGWQAQGTFVHASVFGLYVSLIGVLMYRNAVFIKPKNHNLYTAAFFIGVVSLYASLNRATWLAFAAAMLLFFILDLLGGQIKTRHSKRILFLIIIGLVAGGVRYGAIIVDRFSDAEESMMDDRSSSRKSLALDAVRIIKEHPLVGTGLNNYRMYVDKETAGTKLVHCSYLLVAAELGIPGGILFVILILSFLFIGIRGMRSKSHFVKNSASALVMAQIVFIVAMLPSPDYRILFVKTHIWMVWGLTVSLSKLDCQYKKLMRRQKVEQFLKQQEASGLVPQTERSMRPQSFKSRKTRVR